MEELSHILGFIFMIFTIVLKATISNTNSLSFSSFSLGGNKLFSLDTVWRDSINQISTFTIPVSAVSVQVLVIALPRCVPTDFNSTLSDFTSYKYNDWMPANDDVCAQIYSGTSTQGGAAISSPRKLKQEKLARLVRKVRQTMFNTCTWARIARRILDALFHWTFAFSVCLGSIREPGVLNALEQIRLALARLGRKGVYMVCYRRVRRKCRLYRKYRYYKVPYIIYPNDVLDWSKMPVAVHSSLGHGTVRETWHDIVTLLSPVDFLPTYVQLTEYSYEIRLPHRINPGRRGAGSRKLDTQWTLRTRKRACRRMKDDEWHIIDATKTEVYQNGYRNTSYSAMEYYRLGPQEI